MKNSQWSLVRAGVVLLGTGLMSCFGGGFLLGQPCSSDADCGSLTCRDGYCDGAPCVPNPCLNGGTCSEEEGVAVCECPEGFVGELCDPCEPNPCLNGTCAVGEAGGFSCECEEDWRGEVCDVPPTCGDGIVDLDEDCDDNDDDGDGCAACKFASCGDGFVYEGVEACDDGNESNTDDCVEGCELAQCGDGFLLDGVEDCDDGNESNEDGCLEDCTVASCGDGFVRENIEDCDSPEDPSICTSACRHHSCGDGFVHDGVEECDDGNESNADGCLTDCTAASCGDGFVWEGMEDCDRTGANHGQDSELNGATCEGRGLEPGPLLCSEECGFDTLGCGVPEDMVVVPGGVFEMGSSLSADEEPIRQVTVDTFWMDRTEVTVDAYTACVNDGGACSEPATGTFCNWMEAGREDHPVNCVDWTQAVAYCGWAGKRLPTEAEWEKAARGTDARLFPWGNAPVPTCEYVVMDDEAAGGNGCGENSTWPVGQKPLGDSPYGAQDMSGNVHEWVAGWYGDYDAGETDNPTGPAMGDFRVLRGGSFFEPSADNFRAANRLRDPSMNSGGVGFRCARSAPGAS